MRCISRLTHTKRLQPGLLACLPASACTPMPAGAACPCFPPGALRPNAAPGGHARLCATELALCCLPPPAAPRARHAHEREHGRRPAGGACIIWAHQARFSACLSAPARQAGAIWSRPIVAGPDGSIYGWSSAEGERDGAT